jgi:hypothetical protein
MPLDQLLSTVPVLRPSWVKIMRPFSAVLPLAEESDERADVSITVSGIIRSPIYLFCAVDLPTFNSYNVSFPVGATRLAWRQRSWKSSKWTRTQGPRA